MPIGAAIGAAVVGAGATVISSSNASHAQTQAANQAASIEQQNAAANNQLARDMHADAVARLDPYSQMGLAAGDEYMGLLLGDKGSQHGSGWAPAPATTTTTPTTSTTGSTPAGGYTVGTPSTTVPGTHHMTADEMAYFNSLPPGQQSGYINYLTGAPAPTNALAPVAAPAAAPAPSALHPVVAQQAQAAIAAGANPAAVAQRAAQYGVQL